MVTVYIVRHCEAAGNVTRTFQGTSDTDITELGEKQLAALSDRFKSIHLDAVYSSPLIRAYKTAQSVVGNKKLEIIKEAELRELSGGIIEGMPFSRIYNRFPEIEYTWEFEPQNFCAPEGEPMRSVYERIWNAVLKIARENNGKAVAAATHGGAIRCLICRILHNDIEKLRTVNWSDNTAVTKLIFDDGLNCTAEFINDVSHLSADMLPASHKITSEIPVAERRKTQ